MITMNKQQSGFTLIELIMVIVILGILSAFALPRFADLSGEAETAAVQGALGAVKSAAAIAHSAALAQNQTAATGSVSLEGTAIGLANGYPEADAICVAAGAGDDFTCAVTGTSASGTAVTTVSPGGVDGEPCFEYTEAGTGASPTFSAALGVIASGACT